jgi:hypothetical protein
MSILVLTPVVLGWFQDVLNNSGFEPHGRNRVLEQDDTKAVCHWSARNYSWTEIGGGLPFVWLQDRVSATFNHLHIFAFSVTWAWADVVCLPVQFGPS